jgi:hypothetical protein
LEPAEYAFKRPLPRQFKMASRSIERAELPVQSTRIFIKLSLIYIIIKLNILIHIL